MRARGKTGKRDKSIDPPERARGHKDSTQSGREHPRYCEPTNFQFALFHNAIAAARPRPRIHKLCVHVARGIVAVHVSTRTRKRADCGFQSSRTGRMCTRFIELISQRDSLALDLAPPNYQDFELSSPSRRSSASNYARPETSA